MRNPTLAGLNRRTFSRLVAGSGAAAALAPHVGGVAHASSPSAPFGQEIVRADKFGVNEAFKAMKFGVRSGAGWTRWTVQWFNVQPSAPTSPTNAGLNDHYFRDNRGQSVLEAQINAGLKVAFMVLGTPEWAAETPGLKTGTSVPRGLYTPTMVGGAPNPENPWAVFMFNLARSYGNLCEWFEIWNEVEIPTGGSNAVYNTWAGSAADYYQLVKVASEAAKSGHPNAKIVTSPYSYFKDVEEGKGQTLPFWDAFSTAVSAGGAQVFDAVALNLYRNPHDLWDRVWGGIPELDQRVDRVGFKKRLADMGATGKQLWLTEVNAMPYDDGVPGWDPNAKNDGFRIRMDEQAAYVWQAHALGTAAGWDKIFFQALQDDPYPVPDELWGLVRYNGDANNEDEARARPAYAAYQGAARLLGSAERTELLVRVRPDLQLGKWRQYASRWKWGVHAVMAQTGDTRAYVIWNGTPRALNVNITSRFGSEAKIYNKVGAEQPGDPYNVSIPGATRHFELFGGDPVNYFYVGDDPMIVVERGVPPDAPVSIQNFITKPPREDTLADPDAGPTGDLDDRTWLQPRREDPNVIGVLS